MGSGAGHAYPGGREAVEYGEERKLNEAAEGGGWGGGAPSCCDVLLSCVRLCLSSPHRFPALLFCWHVTAAFLAEGFLSEQGTLHFDTQSANRPVFPCSAITVARAYLFLLLFY